MTPMLAGPAEYGATASVRATLTGLTGDSGNSAKENLGLVPLVDACARYQASDRVELDLGYRLLEGESHNDEAYTFAVFHCAVAGVRVRF
jgi:hypothetical protein